VKPVIAIACAIVAFFAGLCWGGTIYVKPDGTGDAPTIGAAMDSAAVGDTLVLASGTFVGEGNHGLTIPDKNLTIRSETGNPDACVIDCEGEFGLELRDGSVVVKGLTMINAVGSALRMGTFSSVPWINLEVSDCTFTDCEGWGGAIWLYCDGEVIIRRCRFLSNSATGELGGGALHIDSDGYIRVWISGCTFYGNSGRYGGAIFCYYESLVTIRNSVFCHNSADQWGGAIAVADFAEVIGCTFFANSAPLGSAIGGGSQVVRCILAYGTGGSALYQHDPDYYPEVSCTNIYGNEGGDWVGLIADQLGQNGNFSACPGFCYWEMEPYDLHLCSTSPCLPGNHPDGANCGLIGALGQGCDCGPSGVEPTSWGAIKAMYK
jgi:hypothetical protein